MTIDVALDKNKKTAILSRIRLVYSDGCVSFGLEYQHGSSPVAVPLFVVLVSHAGYVMGLPQRYTALRAGNEESPAMKTLRLFATNQRLKRTA